MKWFDDHIETHTDLNSEDVDGVSPERIAEIADLALDARVMADFVRDFFHTQKRFGEFLRVGESTVAGWMKSKSFPDYAKRASLAAYLAGKHWRDLAEARRDAEHPKVVKIGDTYSIVQFKADAVGVSIGEVLAADIPTEKAALVFAGSLVAWKLLEEADVVLEEESDRREERGGWITDLRAKVASVRMQTFSHELLLENELAMRAAMKLTSDDLGLDLGCERSGQGNSKEEEGE